MHDKKNIEDMARRLMHEAVPAQKPLPAKPRVRKTAPPKPELMPTFRIDGNVNNLVIGSNNTLHITDQPIKPAVVVQTGIGVLDTAQKSKLLALRDDVVAASVVRKAPRTPAAVMVSLNKYMVVNSYHEILATDFEKARKWLTRQIAILHSMASAPKKLPTWRNRRIQAIHTRCKQAGYEEWRYEYMHKKFGVKSMIDLSDADLELLYRAVMTRK